MKSNNLIISIHKSNCMLFFVQKKHSTNFLTVVDNSTLKYKEFVNYLGVLTDEKLLRKNHIGKLCSKMSNRCWALLRLRNLMDQKTLPTIYYFVIILT